MVRLLTKVKKLNGLCFSPGDAKPRSPLAATWVFNPRDLGRRFDLDQKTQLILRYFSNMERSQSRSFPPIASTSPVFRRMVIIAGALVLAILSLSATIRLTNAGLGCADWPACYGREVLAATASVLPQSAAALVHRLAATVLAVVILMILALSLRAGRGRPALGLLALTVFLALIGIVTPGARFPLVTLGNLLGGLAMLGMLFWLLLDQVGRPAVPNPVSGVRRGARLGLIVLVAQIALGGWVSANYAALSCTDFPGCAGDGWSAAGMNEAWQLWRRLPSDAHGTAIREPAGAAIHLVHRIGALVTVVVLGWLSVKTWRLGATFRALGLGIAGLLALQVALGVTAVLTSLPLALVLGHNTVAALLLLSVLTLNHWLTNRPRQ
jgi:cytochrome c oxidase assembly protein subunit 15